MGFTGVISPLKVESIQTSGISANDYIIVGLGPGGLGFLGSPYERDCYFKGTLSNPKPPTQNYN